MSTRSYLCRTCGELRRAPAVYPGLVQTRDDPQGASAWPKHCGQPMEQLSYEQGVAATKIESEERIEWASRGLHILYRGGKQKGVPALNDRQIEQSRQQLADFLARRNGSKPKSRK